MSGLPRFFWFYRVFVFLNEGSSKPPLEICTHKNSHCFSFLSRFWAFFGKGSKKVPQKSLFGSLPFCFFGLRPTYQMLKRLDAPKLRP
jgi:hypothetical protein